MKITNRLEVWLLRPRIFVGINVWTGQFGRIGDIHVVVGLILTWHIRFRYRTAKPNVRITKADAENGIVEMEYV